jgi:hypothetical protein
MCGILGTFICGNLSEEDRNQASKVLRHLFTSSLSNSITRGRDATGINLIFKNKMLLMKQAVDVDDFFDGKHQTDGLTIESVYDQWKKADSSFISAVGHVRAATHGSEYEYVNNHPIVVKKGDRYIVGVHNGVLSNHEKVYKDLDITPVGEVDSEAIFQAIAHFAGDNKITLDSLVEACAILKGSYVSLTTDTRDKTKLYVAVSSGRPINIFYLPEISSGVIISEASHFLKAVRTYNRSVLINAQLVSLTPEKSLETLSDEAFIIDMTKEVSSVRDLLSNRKKIAEPVKKTASCTTLAPLPAMEDTTEDGSEPENWDPTDMYQTDEDQSDETTVGYVDTKETDEVEIPETIEVEGEITDETTTPLEEDPPSSEIATQTSSFSTEEDYYHTGERVFESILEKEDCWKGWYKFLSINSAADNAEDCGYDGAVSELCILLGHNDIKDLSVEQAETVREIYKQAFSEGYTIGYIEAETELGVFMDGEEEEAHGEPEEEPSKYIISQNLELRKTNTELRKTVKLLLKKYDILEKAAKAMFMTKTGNALPYRDARDKLTGIAERVLTKGALKAVLNLVEQSATSKKK